MFAFAVLFSYNGCVNEDLGKGASGMEETNAFSETVIQQLQQALLAWYRAHHRDLPWRREVSAYRTWVSEIMLQQTRVEAVIPYFERFLHVLPTLADLAVADDALLHKLWEGLGYYSRVRNMKKCAEVCVERYGGRLPSSYEELCRLPGIGPYTAGAIASIAAQERVAAVDGNVLRVFSRILANREDIAKEVTKKHYRQYVSAFLPEAVDAGDFNQAIMELGAMVCSPNGAPSCAQCPVAAWCRAHAQGTEQEFPVRSAKKARRIEEHTVLVLVDQGRIALQQRPAKGLLAGLHGFAMSDERWERQQVEARYPHARNIVELHPHTHVFSHVEWHMNAFLVEESDPLASYHSLEEIEENMAIPTAFRPFYEAARTWIRMKGATDDTR